MNEPSYGQSEKPRDEQIKEPREHTKIFKKEANLAVAYVFVVRRSVISAIIVIVVAMNCIGISIKTVETNISLLNGIFLFFLKLVIVVIIQIAKQRVHVSHISFNVVGEMVDRVLNLRYAKVDGC